MTKTKIRWEATLEKCKECPFSKTEVTVGAGCADDRVCSLTPDGIRARHWSTSGPYYKVVRGYIESSREEPPVPDWCPLRVKRTKKGNE